MRVITMTLLVAFAAAACGREPTSPDRTVVPAFSATTTWTRSSVSYDFPGVWVACRGETMHFFGAVPYQMHEVTTASGGSQTFFQLSPQTPNTPPYYAVGEQSGAVLLYKNGLPLNESFQLGPGETHTSIDHEVYLGDSHDRLTVSTRSHLTVNANGELVVDRMGFSDFQCR